MSNWHATTDLRWTRDGVLKQRWTSGERIAHKLPAPESEHRLPGGKTMLLFDVEGEPSVGCVVEIDGQAARVTSSKRVTVAKGRERHERLSLQADPVEGTFGDEWREVPTEGEEDGDL